MKDEYRDLFALCVSVSRCVFFYFDFDFEFKFEFEFRSADCDIFVT